MATDLPKVAANFAAVRPADPPPMMTRSYETGEMSAEAAAVSAATARDRRMTGVTCLVTAWLRCEYVYGEIFIAEIY
eukprot:2471286-Prymnesium_polylepis.1